MKSLPFLTVLSGDIFSLLKMQIFYSTNIKDTTCVLDENESRHCIKVLRLSKGSRINVIDGKGDLYEGVIINPDPRRCEITITAVIHDFEKRRYRLHIGISPIKNRERFEWFIEKSVEIGIDEITPVMCRNTEKTGIKAERVNNIIISAMKQSLKTVMPVFNKPVPFEDFITYYLPGVRMIASCSSIMERSKIETVYHKNESAVILIGPEGDFSEEEIIAAVKNEYKPVHFGTSRLRTETAGIVACHSIYYINHQEI